MRCGPAGELPQVWISLWMAGNLTECSEHLPALDMHRQAIQAQRAARANRESENLPGIIGCRNQSADRVHG